MTQKNPVVCPFIWVHFFNPIELHPCNSNQQLPASGSGAARVGCAVVAVDVAVLAGPAGVAGALVAAVEVLAPPVLAGAVVPAWGKEGDSSELNHLFWPIITTE